MNTYTLTPESFLKDVQGHVLTVVREDGVYRHLNFRTPGSGCYAFDLITWPGFLAYVGDMGHFIFERTEDMLKFFRRPPTERLLTGIDMRYWAEKCCAEETSGPGIREWDPDAFRREITDQRRKLLVRHGRDWTKDQREDFWSDMGNVMFTAEYEHEAVHEIQNWFYVNPVTRKHLHIDTCEFPSCKTYSHGFRWCCYALAWGVHKYDSSREVAA